MGRLIDRLESARQVLASLDELVVLTRATKVERDAAIQRFEHTCEATWKAIQLGLRDKEGIQAASPKAIAREARRAGLLDDSQARLALAMVDDRNDTVHTHNEAVAQAIHSRLGDCVHLLPEWIGAAAHWIA